MSARCGTCSAVIKPDVLTGTTCDCAKAPAVVELIATGDRVVAAFRQLGETLSATQALILRKECEASMVAFAAALSRAKGGAA